MTNETKQLFIARLKSFAWRLGSYTLVSMVAFLGDNAGLFVTNPQLVALIALFCGELTKALNTK